MEASQGFALLVRSPLHTMNKCYDKLPIFYNGQIKFVDTITRPTLPDTMPQDSSDHIKNLFQTDMDKIDSSFSIIPQYHKYIEIDLLFSQNGVASFRRDQFPESINAGLYTKGQLSDFWDNILMSFASENASKKFTRNLIVHCSLQFKEGTW